MKYNQICNLGVINDTDQDKVRELAESIKTKGWLGCPILVCGNGEMLLTGSHRLKALHLLDAEGFNTSSLGDIAEDVTHIMDEALEKEAEERGCEAYEVEWSQDNIGWLLEGSWVEDYKNEIEEW